MEDVPEATGGVRLAAGPGPQVAGLWRAGELLAWLGGLVLTLGAFMGWYSVEGDLRGRLSVLGWNTGAIGKLVFVIGLGYAIRRAHHKRALEQPLIIDPPGPEEFPRRS